MERNHPLKEEGQSSVSTPNENSRIAEIFEQHHLKNPTRISTQYGWKVMLIQRPDVEKFMVCRNGWTGGRINGARLDAAAERRFHPDIISQSVEVVGFLYPEGKGDVGKCIALRSPDGNHEHGIGETFFSKEKNGRGDDHGMVCISPHEIILVITNLKKRVKNEQKIMVSVMAVQTHGVTAFLLRTPHTESEAAKLERKTK
jgi:hypothetical protein